MKYALTLFAVLTALLTASCSSLIVKTTQVFPEPVAVVAAVEVPVAPAVPAESPVAQHPSAQEEPTAPTVEPVLPATPVVAVLNSEDVRCMAMAIYHEARGESARGQTAVGYVVVNRVEHGGYGKGICGVVYKRSRRGCQFSWVCDRLSDTPRDQKAYALAQRVARAVLTGDSPNPVGKARYFDGFVHGKKRNAGVTQIGRHRFYAQYANR